MTRLLNTAMNGTATETEISSCSEGLGGVSMCWMRRMPPLFCAVAALTESTDAVRPAASTRAILVMFIGVLPPAARGAIDASQPAASILSHQAMRRLTALRQENADGDCCPIGRMECPSCRCRLTVVPLCNGTT